MDEVVKSQVASNGQEFPHHPISPSDLRVLLRESDVAAARMARRFRLPIFDRDDLRQDILLDLLRRIRTFDPKRGTFGAFVGTIAGHRAARLIKNMQRRPATSSAISLDELAVSSGASLPDTIAEADA